MAKTNKRFLFILLIVFIFTQSDSFGQLYLGARIGANLSNLRGSSVENNSMIAGYNIGGIANYSMKDMLNGDIADILSIQAELSVQTKGTKSYYKYQGIIDTSNVKQNFTYVQIPILAKFTFGDPRGIKFFAEGGLFGASLFGLKVDGQKSRDHDNNKSTDRRKFSEEYAGFDFGVVGGAGIVVPFGGRRSPWAFYGNLRYSLGLNNIGDFKQDTDIREARLKDIKTSAISILFGFTYKVPIKEK